MDVRWYGQSAFLLTGEKSVFVDPFGDPASVASHGLEFRFPRSKVFERTSCSSPTST